MGRVFRKGIPSLIFSLEDGDGSPMTSPLTSQTTWQMRQLPSHPFQLYALGFCASKFCPLNDSAFYMSTHKSVALGETFFQSIITQDCAWILFVLTRSLHTSSRYSQIKVSLKKQINTIQ